MKTMSNKKIRNQIAKNATLAALKQELYTIPNYSVVILIAILTFIKKFTNIKVSIIRVTAPKILREISFSSLLSGTKMAKEWKSTPSEM